MELAGVGTWFNWAVFLSGAGERIQRMSASDGDQEYFMVYKVVDWVQGVGRSVDMVAFLR